MPRICRWRGSLTLCHGLLITVLLLSGFQSRATILATVSDDCVSCNGNATFTTDALGDVSYEWYNELGGLLFVETNNIGTSSLFNLCPGLYQVQWNNGIENGQEWFTINTLTTNAGQPGEASICSTSGAYDLFEDVTGAPTTGGQWYDVLGNPFDGTIDPAVDSEGFYAYQLIEGGCTVTSGVQLSIIQNADPGLSTTYLICEDYLPFELLDVLAGDPDAGGQWFDSDVNEFIGTYDPAINETGLFTYRIDSVEGCGPVFSTMMVIENPLPNPGLNTTISVCPTAVSFNMTDQLNGDPQSDGIWYDEQFNAISPEFDVDVLGPGTYNYVVSGLTPCPIQESFLTVEFTSELSPGVGASIDVCDNLALLNLFSELGGSPTPDGLWSGPLGEVENGILETDQLISGDYIYEVEGVGCLPVSSTINVVVEESPFAGTGGNIVVCETVSPITPTDLLTDADPGGQWTIVGEPLVGDLIVEGGSTYDLLYTVNGTFCPNDATTYSVQSDSQPNAGDDQLVPTCITDGSIALADLVYQTDGFASEWIDPLGDVISPTLDLSIAPEGDYTFIVYADNTCSDIEVTLILEIGVPAFENGTAESTGCAQGQLVELETFLPADVPVGGEWSLDGEMTPSSLVLNGELFGEYHYQVINDAGCPPSDFQLTLDYSQPLTAGAGTPITLCSDANAFDLDQQLTNNSAGGSWYDDGLLIDGQFHPQADEPGFFQYVVPANGYCESDTAEVEVTVQEGFEIDLGAPIEICTDQTNPVIVVEDCDDCGFVWSEAEFIEVVSENAVELNFTDVLEVTDYQVNVSVSNGVCVVADSLVVSVLPTPVITVSLPDPICQGEEVEFEAFGATSYTWSNNVQASNETAVGTFFGEDQVTVEGVNEFGCSGIAIANVDVFIVPEAVFDLDVSTACSPLVISLEMPYESDELVSYYWEIDDQVYTTSMTEVVLNEPGLYDVTLVAVASNGCQNEFTLDAIFEVYGYPEARFDFNEEELNVQFTQAEFYNQSIDGDSYFWEFGDGATSSDENPIHTYPTAADAGYRVCLTAETDFGCADTLCRELYIPGEFILYVPNAFTPGVDGLNDVFLPVISGIVPAEYSFTIFNRWGEQIFLTTAVDEGWIGNVHNGAHYAPVGVYSWVVEVKDLYSAEVRKVTGHVTLLK